MFIVERTCTEAPSNLDGEPNPVGTTPFSAFEDESAYVLLGEPGSGKTTVFERQADRTGACYVSARDLITFNDQPEWHGNTLFIDGLDEVRAGSADARTPFDTIRARLESLSRPCFRLSCREADWFGTVDQTRLKAVAPGGQLTILHLDPLTDNDIVEILNHDPRVKDSQEFIDKARKNKLSDLLRNPQILEMLIKAVKEDNWPSSRKQTFELACRTTLHEYNEEHVIGTSIKTVDENQLLDAAGFLCALQLITGKQGSR